RLMIELCISGAQSGADLGGAYGSKAAGIPVEIRTFRGFVPVGRKSLPDDLPVRYLDLGHRSYVDGLRKRTMANVEAADMTLIFTIRPIELTKGSLLT